MSASADRNLLFGILAVQLDFVGRDALIAAMNAWVLDKNRALGDILRDLGHLSPERLQLLAALVAEHLKQHGDDPRRSLAALSSVDPVIRSGLNSLADPDVRASMAAASARSGTPRTSELPPAAPSRYEILRPHARGGLGEVFIAQDQELHREVALKEIQPQHADDPENRARFLLEAEITGGLEHPGVVPVYGLGTYADGRPFYAMRFVKGDNLQQAIRRFHARAGGGSAGGESAAPPQPVRRFESLEFRRLLRRFLDVCNAVAYAHSRGALHRDLKPGNVMLGKFGETLVVDWGLAKLTGRIATAGERTDDEPTLRPHSGGQASATVQGRALGTPAYMSPEQAAGRWDDLGPATDVYSLGASLYELLTGRVPFDTTDLDPVQKGLFPPPRQVNPAVPPALAAVCQKAMALRPEDRYATPLALAAEIERWMADEPVSAYPDPWHTRVMRWARRHRAMVAGVAALLVAAVVGLVVLNVHTERARQAVELERAKTAAERDAKEEERQRAVAARNHTREALDAMTSTVTGDALTTQTALSAEQRKFLESVLKYYEEFAAEPGDDREGRERLAKAHLRLGMIRNRLGQADDGVRVFRRSTELFGRLAADHPDVPQYRDDLAACYQNLGNLLAGLGKRAEAEVAYRQALALREALARDNPDNPKYRSRLAGVQNGRGFLFAGLGKLAEAEAAYRAALAVQEALALDHPRVLEYRSGLAGSYINLGKLFSELGKRADAEAVYRQALAVFEALVRDRPSVEEYRHGLAICHHNVGVVLTDLGKRAEAEAAYKQALTVRETLARDHPGVPVYRSGLAATHSNLGILLDRMGKRSEAEAAYRAALAVQEALARDYPGVPEYRRELARSHNNLGILLAAVGKRAEAEATYRASLAVYEALARDYPGVPENALQLGGNYCNLGHFVRDGGEPQAALEWYGKAVGTLDPLVRQDRRFVLARQFLCNALLGRAHALVMLRRYAEAKPDWDRGAELTDDASKRIDIGLFAADSLARAGDPGAAAEVESLLSAAPAPPRRLYDAACVLALASKAVKDDAMADRHAARAVEVLRQAFIRGWADVAHMLKDPDLDPLRRRADFADLLWDVADTPAPRPGDRR